MSDQLNPSMLALIMLCVFLEAARELCFKEAADGESLKVALLKPLTLIGMGIWVAEIMATIIVLEHVPLGIAFPLMALVYVVTVLGGVFILKEQISPLRILGTILITVGVACVGISGL